MNGLPSGTVTFLFTDVEGSTRLWEEHPDAMHGVLARHDEIVRGAIESHGGHVVKTTGDGFHAAFATARDALDAALAAQQALTAEPPSQGVSVKVRMGVHTGEARARDGDYYGSSLNRAARLMAVGHGGQIVCSQATADLARDALAEGVVLVDLALARQAGAPLAITLNLLSFAQALAPDDPEQARAMLDEAFQLEATLGYLDATPTFVYAAGRLGAWTATLRAASRTLKHQLRSGAATRVIVAGVMNLAARGLAEDRPEPAAVMQGAVHAVLRGVATTTDAPGLAAPAEPTAVVTFIAGARHDTTQLLIATLGEPRLRELRADGAAMTEDQAYTYARAHIDEYLAAIDRDSVG